MKTKIEIENEIVWFEELLTEIETGNVENARIAVKAAIQVLEREKAEV